MNRVGCPACGNVMDVLTDVLCDCDGELAWLPTASDLLAFRLRYAGRNDEATRVEHDMAVLQEHRCGDPRP